MTENGIDGSGGMIDAGAVVPGSLPPGSTYVGSKTMELPAIQERLHRALPELRRRYGVRSLGVFGSYARGEQRPDSDLDVLVSFVEVPGLIRFVELENDLSDALGLEVDLVLRDALKPEIERRVSGEVIPV